MEAISSDSIRKVMNKVRLLLALMYTAVGGGNLCQCSSLGETSHLDICAWEKSMVQAVNESKPWIELRRTSDSGDDEDVDKAQKSMLESMFDFNRDSPEELLKLARNGDDLAMLRAESYSRSYNKRWKHRHEIARMLALHRGIRGIATYYVKTKRYKSLSHDRVMIEMALRSIEMRALNGSWLDAVVLYQFHGDSDLPWGKSDEQSAKWLDVVWREAGARKFENVIKFELMRAGHGTSKEIYYPHTPKGWRPPAN